MPLHTINKKPYTQTVHIGIVPGTPRDWLLFQCVGSPRAVQCTPCKARRCMGHIKPRSVLDYTWLNNVARRFKKVLLFTITFYCFTFLSGSLYTTFYTTKLHYYNNNAINAVQQTFIIGNVVNITPDVQQWIIFTVIMNADKQTIGIWCQRDIHVFYLRNSHKNTRLNIVLSVKLIYPKQYVRP